MTVPALPGCFTWGKSVDAALIHAREALAGHVAALVESGQPVPVEGDAGAASIATVDVETSAA